MSSFVSTILSLLKICAVVLVLGVAFVVAGYLGVQWSLSAEEFEVPDVKGMELDEARDLLAAQGLIVEVDPTRLTDNEVAEGRVLRQNPLAGTAIKRQRGIRLTLSMGKPQRDLPMVAGDALQRAQIALEQKDVDVEYVARVYSDEFPRDRVISQQPNSTELPEGARVPARLLVSDGPQPPAYVMPDLVYRNGEIVRQHLERLGFRVQVEQSDQRIPGQPPGTILSHRPSLGFKVVRGDRIVLTVNPS
jgi:serine/threonine-protein kinase